MVVILSLFPKELVFSATRFLTILAISYLFYSLTLVVFLAFKFANIFSKETE